MKHLFIVGAQRSGSTYLYTLLDEHHQIHMAKPVSPEPKFFLDSKKFAQGKSTYEATYFSEVSPQVAYCGEKSTSYIESIDAAERIYNFYTDARILIILRDPVLRAWSNYMFSKNNGLETLDFEKALSEEEQRLQQSRFTSSVNPFAYKTRGMYINYIEQYASIFPRENINITIFEELVGNISSIQRIYNWLGIDSRIEPPAINRVINSSNKSGDSRPDNSTMKKLFHEFEDSTVRLESFLNRPIPSWRKRWE